MKNLKRRCKSVKITLLCHGTICTYQCLALLNPTWYNYEVIPGLQHTTAKFDWVSTIRSGQLLDQALSANIEETNLITTKRSIHLYSDYV